MKIPFMNLYRQHQSLGDDLKIAIQNIIETSSFIGGPIKDNFENEFAAFCGANHCIGVGNGTDSLYIALKTLGIGGNDKVITVANSFIASSESISQTGATPVFVDCDIKNFNIDVNLLESKIKETSNVKALIIVHLYGRMAPMLKIMEIAKKYNLFVIEDCAQAHGAKLDGKSAGTFGDFGSFSFYPGKNLGGMGDGGALITNNKDYFVKAKMFANHGRISKYDHEFEGINSRLDTLQAAVLSLKLKKLTAWTERRIELAKKYYKKLSEFSAIVTLPEIPNDFEHVFHLFVIRSKFRNEIQKLLEEKNIQTGIHYPRALPNLKAYHYLNLSAEQFPVATRLESEILSLPLYPELTDTEVDYILTETCQILKDIASRDHGNECNY